MSSLRFRLIVGFALIAVIPLAIAMILLSRRIEDTVRSQAAERVNATLGSLRLQVGSDGRRIEEKLAILGRDPVLKRLYLLSSAGHRDLSDYLAERRILLGLDFLEVTDTSGGRIADAATLAGAEPPWQVEGGIPGPGLTLVPAGDGALAMAAAAPIRYENEAVGFVRGGQVLDQAFLGRLAQASGVELGLTDASGRPVAATFARTAPVAMGETVRRIEVAGRSYLGRSFPLEIGPPPHPVITGLVSTASADRTLAALQWTSVLLGALGLAIAVVLAMLWSLQISRPVERLAAYSHRLAQGEWDEPLTLKSVRELETLVAALDRMRTDLKSYRERLVTSERQAAWSQMARKVAHEIKNPLTPIAVSVADLRRSFEQQRPDFPRILDQAVRTIAEEVDRLKRLLQEFSDYGRFPAPRFAPCHLSTLFTDLEALYGGEVAAGRLSFTAPARDIAFAADAGQLRQALVNLVKNGLEAVEAGGRVTVDARTVDGAWEIAVADDGAGLTVEQRANLFVPGFTTKSHGSGLGLTIVDRIVNEHGGTIAVESEPGRGTTFRIRIPLAAAADAGPTSRAGAVEQTSGSTRS